jgi:hypothetical protein
MVGFLEERGVGQIASSWTSQFVNAYGRLGDQAQALPAVEGFFEGDDEMSRMRPILHAVTVGDITHLYQRRASCCRLSIAAGLVVRQLPVGVTRGASREESGLDARAIE